MAGNPEFVAYLNGRLVPHSEAMAELSEGRMRSAGGLYDAERTFGGEVFKLREHLQRLHRGLHLAHLDPGMSLEGMEAATLDVLEANRPLWAPDDDFIVGQVVTAVPASGTDGPPRVKVAIYCQSIDFHNFARSYVRGVKVETPATYGAPRGSRSDGVDLLDSTTFLLMSDDEANVTGCRRANFLFARDGRIKLPNRQNVLPGISMETVLELAGSLGIPVDEDDYCAADVYVSDEALVSGTRFCLLPVATFNGLSLGQKVPGMVTRRLLHAWSERVGLDIVQQALDHLRPEDTQVVVDTS